MSKLTIWAQVLVRGLWKRMEFPELERGDLFRLYDENAVPIDGGEVHVADDAPFERESLWAIKSHLAGRGEPVRYVDVDSCSYCVMNCDSACGAVSRQCSPDGEMPDWCPLCEGPVTITRVEK